MTVTLGEEGLTKTWQNEFPKETKCDKCNGTDIIDTIIKQVDQFICLKKLN